MLRRGSQSGLRPLTMALGQPPVLRGDLLLCLYTCIPHNLQGVPPSHPTRDAGLGEPSVPAGALVWEKVMKGGHVVEMTVFGS